MDGDVSRHGIAHPAAQGQQKNHEGENQKAHRVMIVGVKKSSTITVDADDICYIYNSNMR